MIFILRCFIINYSILKLHFTRGERGGGEDRVGKGGEGGKGGEMTQTLYACMNKRKKNKN
jgi:hypothetical protein